MYTFNMLFANIIHMFIYREEVWYEKLEYWRQMTDV